jgi:hypothetical protein
MIPNENYGFHICLSVVCAVHHMEHWKKTIIYMFHNFCVTSHGTKWKLLKCSLVTGTIGIQSTTKIHTYIIWSSKFIHSFIHSSIHTYSHSNDSFLVSLLFSWDKLIVLKFFLHVEQNPSGRDSQGFLGDHHMW